MIISIKDINSDMILSENVYSANGGILYKKNTTLKYIDMEILEAFGVKKIEIEENEIITENNTEKSEKVNVIEKTDSDIDLFMKHFRHALITVEKIIKLAQGNAVIPIMELRNVLRPLLCDEYMHIKYLSLLKFNSLDFNKYDSHHALSVGVLSYAIANWIEIDKGERMQVALAGTLHDIGMSRIPNNIVGYNGNLDLADYKEIRKHTLYGYQILKGAKGLNEGALLAVLQHHEREDGSGYPLKLKKDQIHVYAKIIAIADVYHAMVSKRNYREQFSAYQAVDQLLTDSYSKLDSLMIKIFTKEMIKLTIGTKVLLNNGQEGNIIKMDSQSPTKPCVKVGDSIINLLTDKTLYIKQVL